MKHITIVKRLNLLMLALAISLIISACNSQTAAAPDEADSPQLREVKLPPVIDRDKVNKLAAIKTKLSSHIGELQKTFSIQVLGYGSGAEDVMMTIRRAGDVEKPITKEEVSKIREALYVYAGEKFPLNLDVRDCCSGSGDLTGKLKSIENDRVLIVNENKKNGNTDDPEATWVKLTEDGIVTKKGSKEKLSFEKLAIGQQVNAWSTGMMLTSYPGQASVVKIEIAD